MFINKKFICFLLFVGCWLQSSNILAKPFGQYYGFIGGLRFNSTAILFEQLNARLSPVSLALGLYIVAGDSKKTQHFADFGIMLYQHQLTANIDFNTAPELFGMREFHLGYIYHYSTNYDTTKKSHNIHIGFGLAYHVIRIEAITLRIHDRFTYEARGSYFRISYFRNLPLTIAKPIIVGVNLTYKSFSGASFTNYTVSISRDTRMVSTSQASALNSVEVAFLLGSPF